MTLRLVPRNQAMVTREWIRIQVRDAIAAAFPLQAERPDATFGQTLVSGNLERKLDPGTDNTWVRLDPVTKLAKVTDQVQIGGGSDVDPEVRLQVENGSIKSMTTDTGTLDAEATWTAGATTFLALLLDVLDTASAAASRLLSLRVGGVELFGVRKDGMLTTHLVPCCRVSNTTDQSVASGTDTPLAFDAERFDTDVMHDPVTNNTRITFNTPGRYHVGACIEWEPGSGGDPVSVRMLAIRLNGTRCLVKETDDIRDKSDQPINQAVSCDFQFIATDYIEVLAYQTSGNALNVVTTDFGILPQYCSPEAWAHKICS